MKDNHINDAFTRGQRWRILLENKYPYIWLPRFIDVVLNYQEDLPVDAYLKSDLFLAAAKQSLLYDAQCHIDRGIPVEDLTLNMIFDDRISWMPGFIEMLICRVKGIYANPWFLTFEGQKELRSLCLDNIYRIIPRFDPVKCSFEGCLHSLVPWSIGNDLRKEWRRERNYTSLDAYITESQDITLIDVISAPPTSYEIKEVDLDALKSTDVFASLGFVLQNASDWDLFFQATYCIRSCSEIARVRRITKSAVSQKLDLLRRRLAQACQMPQAAIDKKKLQFRRFAKDFAAAISKEQFLEKVPRPSSLAEPPDGMFCFSR